ncbi:hypothetical protein [Litoribrevibacter albus]|nr:hypothetical protein [Litoribrevibacter albus]
MRRNFWRLVELSIETQACDGYLFDGYQGGGPLRPSQGKLIT